MDSIAKLARGALTAQSACNLSGVVHSFSQTLTELWAHAQERGEGTDWVNTHPICVLYSTQIAHLSSGSLTDSLVYSQAYTAVCAMLHGAATHRVRNESRPTTP